ncbi:zonular occludens toxin domain-containing protein [Mannheimia indoligenes]|uniref:zonular occludens toxin domain-containing protein n=1 Tax=Mannheimia indoligenes TaxID=3103145 RepID=UPI002FE59139
MAINAYVGVPGSGKTYEVVASVILPAFLNGRRIVTNIEGVSQDKFLDYIDEQNKSKKERTRIDYSSLGTIIKVNDEDVLKPNFFPYKGSLEETIAKNGDLICLDEIWRIFDDNKKILEEHKSFLAEHRHFVNERGNTSDLVVINQSISNVPKFIKDRIENTYKMTKLLAIGMRNRYRVDVYSGAKLYKTNLIQSIQAKYNPKIFKLYKSYDNDNAKEQSIDNRGNIFRNTWFILKMLFSLLFIIGGSIYLYNTYNKQTSLPNEEKNVITHNEDKQDKKQMLTTNYKNSSFREQEQEEIYHSAEKDKGLSNKWRIIGYIKKDNKNLVILTDDKYIRYEYLSSFSNDGNLLSGHIDGYRVTFYSGQTSRTEKDKEAKKW